MSEQSIFEQSTPNNTSEGVVNPSTNSPVVPQELMDLVGEGKKYRTVEDAIKSVPHAQSHIKKLEEEMAQLREELTKRKTAEELLDSFKSASQQPSEATPPVSLDQDVLMRTVEAALSQAEQKKSTQANITSVVNTFNSVYGEKGAEMYQKLAEEVGVQIADLNRLAASSPSAVFKLAGIGQHKESAPGKPTSSVNTQGLQNTQQGQQPLSAKVPKGATTKDLVSAWKNAGEMVKKDLGIN